MASRSEDVGGTSMVRQSSSSSCASQASTRSSLSNLGANLKAAADNAPYIKVMKTQLNFFMTRLLYMQEDQADSLGAARARRNLNNSLSNMGNNSNSSFNNSGSKGMDHSGSNLLGSLMERDDDGDSLDDICVFADNARILPNSAAKSMPPVPFPPAAPESPRPVEGKDGLIYMTSSHHSASPKKHPELAHLPNLVSGMGLDDSSPELESVTPDDIMDQEEEDDDEEEEQVPKAVVVPNKPRPKRTKSFPTRVPAIPADQRVFPKNQRRSKRFSNADGGSMIKRSQSDVSGKDDLTAKELSSSFH